MELNKEFKLTYEVYKELLPDISDFLSFLIDLHNQLGNYDVETGCLNKVFDNIKSFEFILTYIDIIHKNFLIHTNGKKSIHPNKYPLLPISPQYNYNLIFKDIQEIVNAYKSNDLVYLSQILSQFVYHLINDSDYFGLTEDDIITVPKKINLSLLMKIVSFCKGTNINNRNSNNKVNNAIKPVKQSISYDIYKKIIPDISDIISYIIDLYKQLVTYQSYDNIIPCMLKILTTNRFRFSNYIYRIKNNYNSYILNNRNIGYIKQYPILAIESIEHYNAIHSDIEDIINSNEESLKDVLEKIVNNILYDNGKKYGFNEATLDLVPAKIKSAEIMKMSDLCSDKNTATTITKSINPAFNYKPILKKEENKFPNSIFAKTKPSVQLKVGNDNPLQFVSKLAGSTGPELHKNTHDKKWVVKKGSALGGFKQTQYESLANDIYAVVGIPVPHHILDEKNKALILEFIEGKSLASIKSSPTFDKIKKDIQKGFVIDALLANWDVIGLNMDNILIPANESSPVRIDNGGTFIFRAQGGKKPFGKAVTELDTLRDKKAAPQASIIFGDLTDTDIDAQIKELIIPNYDKILAVIPAADTELYNLMKDRLDYLVERTVWTNSSQFRNTVKETETPEFIEAVQKGIVAFFKSGKTNNTDIVRHINELLTTHNAIISGGFILKSIGKFKDEKSVDIDIYVPTKNAHRFRNEMQKVFGATTVVKHVVSDSIGFFFKKNSIISVTKFSRSKPSYAEMDIVEVNESTTPINIVKNFDLTFCENWYDGKTVYMTHPEHVANMYGFIENHYLPLLFKKNAVLINRAKKYISRGFKIWINHPQTKKPEDITAEIVDNTFLKGYNFVPANTQRTKTTGKTAFTNEQLYELSEMVPTHINQSRRVNKINMTNIKNVVSTIRKNNLPLVLTKNIVPPHEISSLNRVDQMVISWYTGTGSSYINPFLWKPDVNILRFNEKIFNIIAHKYPNNGQFSEKVYNMQLMYYYFITLYNALQKSINAHIPFIVVRGTQTWYLQEDYTKFYYINSFTSTTTREATATGFGGSSKIYKFYVHPACQYMNITNISQHKQEEEILFNPYHRYMVIGTKGNTKIVVVMPTDLKIPDNFDEFMEWKKTVATMTVKKGGRLFKSNTTLKIQNNIKLKNNNPIIPVINKKLINISSKKMSALNNTRRRNIKTNTTSNTTKNTSNSDRFTEPLPSFPGKAPTEDEMKVIKQMIAYFNEAAE